MQKEQKGQRELRSLPPARSSSGARLTRAPESPKTVAPVPRREDPRGSPSSGLESKLAQARNGAAPARGIQGARGPPGQPRWAPGRRAARLRTTPAAAGG
eukprot:11561166-Alexandrium_andersonii.AAC.1